MELTRSQLSKVKAKIKAIEPGVKGRCKILVDDGVIVLATNDGVRIPKQVDISISQYLRESPIVVVSVLVDSEHIVHSEPKCTYNKDTKEVLFNGKKIPGSQFVSFTESNETIGAMVTFKLIADAVDTKINSIQI